MAFEVPNPFKVKPTRDEKLFEKSWDIIRDSVLYLQKKGFQYSLKGKAELALKNYEGANYFYYMIMIAQAARYRLGILGLIGVDGNAEEIDELYQLSCIDKALPCKGAELGVDFLGAWNSILALFGIDRQKDVNTDCCIGIGEMIVGFDDTVSLGTIDEEENADCAAFIIGPCNLIDSYRPDGVEEKGEFALGEFKKGEFTNFNETED